jgi:hypothetical protein
VLIEPAADDGNEKKPLDKCVISAAQQGEKCRKIKEYTE